MNWQQTRIDGVSQRAVRDALNLYGNPLQVLELLQLLRHEAADPEIRQRAARGACLILAAVAFSCDEPFVPTVSDQKRMGYQEPSQ